jgi:PAS domain S-box-containing protein
MLASSLDAVITVDDAGRVITFNPAAVATFGYSEEEALGRDIAELIIPPSLRDRHHGALQSHLRTGSRTILNRRVELVGMRADGSEFPVELTVTRVGVDGPPTFTAYLRDITDRKTAEAELRASRQRVLEVADRERRRIERNLHDGAQQRLVGIRMFLHRVAREPGLPAPMAELMATAQDQVAQAIAELRELAAGIHPAALSESGLSGALRGLGLRSPFEVIVDAPRERLPESVEVAFYYVAAEALANAAKHAAPTRVDIAVAHGEGEATLRVHDDGPGGAKLTGGSGLTGLMDRLEALGGSLSVQSDPGHGTTLTAVAPLH